MMQGGTHWSTSDELQRLEGLAEVEPLGLLAAYNGIQVREKWGSLDGETIKTRVKQLARRVLQETPSLRDEIPREWPHALRFAEAVLGKVRVQ